MSSLLAYTLVTFGSVFSIVDPFAAVPIFLALAGAQPGGTLGRTAFRASATCFVVLSVFAVAGNFIFSFFGITLPAGPLVFLPRTVVVALVVGIGVTVVSAISPARRAVAIPPVAALSDQHEEQGESSRRRIAVGGVIAAVGVAALVVGLSEQAIALVGIGAVAIFLGIGMLAPVVARPMASVLGRPLALFGISGRLGRENSMRSPRRTAQTSAALMVGLALVSTIAVFGASLSKSATSSVDEAISADYIITASARLWKKT